MTTISKIQPKSLAMSTAGVGFFLGIINSAFFVLSTVFLNTANAGSANSLIFLILLPIVYVVVGWLMGAIVAVSYNFFARKFGGIVVQLEDIG